MRFVLVSFGFLAMAFYELSGGADFDPEAHKAARIAALEQEKQQEATKVAAAKPAAPKPVVLAAAPTVAVEPAATTTSADRAEVSRVALNLTTLQPASTRAEPVAAASAGQPTLIAASAEAVPQNVGFSVSSSETPAIIPSLIDPNDGVAAVTTTSLQSDEALEIRTVAGNAVNVRGGPGTGYGVVGRLVRGDAIKVLENSGDGWVRFVSLDGLTDGWMAEFLLEDG